MKRIYLLIIALCCYVFTTFANVVPGKEYTVKMTAKELSLPKNSNYICDFTVHVRFSQAYYWYDTNKYAFLAKYWIESLGSPIAVPASGGAINVTVYGTAPGFYYTINLPLIAGGTVHGVQYDALYAGYTTNQVSYVIINSYPTSYLTYSGCLDGTGSLMSFDQFMSAPEVDTFPVVQ